MDFEIEVLDFDCDFEVSKLNDFLSVFDLRYEDVDYTVFIKENDSIIATCSKKGNVIKCFAVDEAFQGMGISNLLVSKITDKLFEEGIFHNYIYTKVENSYLFKALGYKIIIETDKVCLLESGNRNINSTLDKLLKEYDIDNEKDYAALVMNCNPFTLGHRYLIEKVASENDNVLVFVVEEDKSIFKFKNRFDLVRVGVSDLTNVKVLRSSEYVISSATFPSYFLKKSDDVLKEYTKLDANIFGKYFCDKFNIKVRYVGSEPSCLVTSTYNETLKEVLPKYNVDVKVVDRMKVDEEVISASKVRELILEDKIEKVKKIVPKITYDFLISEEGEKIQDDIKRGR